METKKMELNQEQMEQVTGARRKWIKGGNCDSTHRVKTGNDREDSRFIFWSQHQYEYLCLDCGHTFWVDEER